MLRLLLLTFSLSAFLCADTPALDKPLGDSSRGQAESQADQVQVSGVVTFLEPAWQSMVIQDGEQVIRVGLRREIELPDSLTVGDIVKVDGRRESASDIRRVAADIIVRTGTGELPKPISLKGEAAISRRNEDRFVECDGVVFRFDSDSVYAYLSISTPQSPLRLCVRLPDNAVPVRSEWLGQTVQVRGVLRIPSGEELAGRILSSMPLLQRVPATNARLDAGAEFQLIKTLSDSNRDVTRPLNIIGQAISSSPSSDLIVRDHTWRVRVESSKLPEISTGDIVIVRGFVNDIRGRLPVLSGKVERLGPGVPLEPTAVATDEAAAHAYEYIVTEGTFRGFRQTGEKRFPVLKNMDTTFTLSGPDEVLAVFDRVPIESHFRVIGTSWPTTGKAYAFELLTSDVEIVYQPSLPPHVGDGVVLAANSISALPTIPTAPPGGLPPYPGPIGPMIVAGVACLLMAVFLVAFLVVLRRTREQQKFYATIHEQLNEVSHVSRLNTLSEMVGALAHELNQPLASVSNFAETARLLNQRPGDRTPQFDSLLERIGAESLRAGEIIRRLRSLVQRKTPGQVSTSINQVVCDALDMFRMQELVANGTLNVELDDDLPSVEVDPIQFQQVILNFLLNARDATTGLEGRLAKITVRSERSTDRLTVSVEDNGCGISSSDPKSVFEPYFTTKEDGMGLGLAISRTIVESHNGTIHAENLKPCGARLSISLPIEPIVKLDAA